MPKQIRIVLLLAVVAVIAFFLYQRTISSTSKETTTVATTASGTIESDDVAIAAEIGGRILRLEVDEGNPVSAGQIVVQIDDTLLAAQVKQAEAALDVARSNLNLVKAKTGREEMDQARAAVAQTKANRDGSQRALDNAIAIRNNPQDINTRIDAARAEYDAINVEGARVAWQNALAQVQDPQDLQTRIDAAQAEFDSINVEGAWQAWQNVIAQRDQPQDLNQRISATQAQLNAADAQIQQAKNLLNQQYILRDGTCGLRGKTSSECLAANAGAASAASAVQTAQANRDQVKRNLDGLLDQKANPIILNTQVDAAKTAYDTMVARKEAVRRNLDTLAAIRENPLGLAALADAAKANYDTLVAMKQGALRNLNGLMEIRDNPLALNASVDNARAQLDVAEAALASAQAKVAQLDRGATAEQVDVAQSQVAQAQSAVEVLRAQLAKLALRSPINGVVNKRSVLAGEMAAAGATLLNVVNLDELYLTLYIPEREIGAIKLGQVVDVTVDAFPGRVFTGEVSFISGKAEYTPRNVQTKKERVNLVFAVKVQLANPGQELKAGMPADAVVRK
jgi:multidrug resistance efflux pump